MLKVVGASWLQTRIATYILVAVALLGIGAIIIGEFGRVENDGTYSATVSWNSKEAYRINFWGQGNDLESLPMGAARAYYKTRMHEIGWSIVEIETSSDYPDEVQAYSAGLLEGSLTWQIIHHHWFNTISAACRDRISTCETIREQLREHLVIVKKRAADLEAEDPFWHMIRLFYAQLDGLEAGWRFAVRRSRKSVDMSSVDFFWLAVASDLPNFQSSLNANDSPGAILLKNLHNDMSEPLIALIHNTIAPYAKMLRLLKKYTFGYHMTGLKNATRVPTRSIVISSYPGALSSQDEYYILNGEKTTDIMVLAGTSITTTIINESHSSANDLANIDTDEASANENQTESSMTIASPKTMAANWLSSDTHTWSRLLARRDGPGSVFRPFQWVMVRATDMSIWLVEQHPTMTHAIEYTKEFNEKGILFCDGNSLLVNREMDEHPNTELNAKTKAIDRVPRATKMERRFNEWTTKIEMAKIAIKNDNHEVSTKNNDSYVQNLSTKLLNDTPGVKKTMTFRGDLEPTPKAIGAIDSKLSLVNVDGISKFEASSGPARSDDDIMAFQWSAAFPNTPHIGHPDKFNFITMTPTWVWF